jgi:hypothetical protein
LFVASVASAFAFQQAERRDALGEITAQALREHVTTLAADELAGRRTGTAGAAAAARYLAGVLEVAGIEPAGDEGTFLQRMPMEQTEYSAVPKLTLRLADGTEMVAVYGVDFDVVAGAGEIASSALTFASSLEEIPREAPEDGVLYASGSSRERGDWLEAAGCPEGEGWALLVTRGSRTTGRRARTDPPRGRNEIAPTPIVRVRGELLQRFEAREVRHLAYSAPAKMRTLESYNVVGRLPGGGTPDRPELARETIVFSAHYDHLGQRGDSEQADTIYNGADDDASGCAAVLELARAFGKGPKPARTLVFLLATGEEIGLIGTRFYLDHPAEPLENTVTNLNFEMIGRPDELIGGAGKLWLTGFERTNLGEAFQASGLPVTEDLRPEQSFFRRSDNFAFARKGIVAQTLSSYNMHTDYHTVRDEADKLDYGHMQTCVRAAYSGARSLADGSLTPAWKPGGNPAEKARDR